MNNALKIVTWNANGLMQHIEELLVFLNTEKIDICLITESHLTRSSNLNISGYCCYHAIHPADRARGGSSLLVKDSIKHYEDSKIEEEKIQATTINVHVLNKMKIKVSAIYCPPKHNLKKDDYIRFFQTLGSYFIVGGDFNAKNTFWGSRLTNTKGRELYSAGRALNCDFHSSAMPTHWPVDQNKIPDLIDFYVGKGISDNYIYVENKDDLSSDHSPVLMTVSVSILKTESQPRLINHKTNWLLFRQALEDSINLQVPIKTSFQLEEEIELFNTNIQQAAWISTPICQKKRNVDINYPYAVKVLIRKKRKARKNLAKNPNT